MGTVSGSSKDLAIVCWWRDEEDELRMRQGKKGDHLSQTSRGYGCRVETGGRKFSDQRGTKGAMGASPRWSTVVRCWDEDEVDGMWLLR